MLQMNDMEWIVLDATMDDWESLETIYNMMDHNRATEEKGVPLLADVADALVSLYSRGLVDIKQSEEDSTAATGQSIIWKCWFKINVAGLELHSSNRLLVEEALARKGYS